MSPSVADSVSPNTAFKRLPTNPRRRKVPAEQRKRVIRACNACNVRRVKCSGLQPCTNCSASSRTCEYPTEQQKITIPEETYKELQERCSMLERCLEEAVPSEKSREALLAKFSKQSSATNSASSSEMEGDEHEKTGDGLFLQDPEGIVRYMGESSGAAFMNRLREFVGTVLPLLSVNNGPLFGNAEETFTSLLGKYHTHDSRPLMLPENIDPYAIPSPDQIAKLIHVFRFFSHDGIGSPFGGIYYWGDLWELADQARRYAHAPSQNLRNDSRILANLNAVLALACQFDPSHAPSWETHPGETYFARAKFLLANPLEDANPLNMRILCLMGHFMLGIYRRDAAYLYIGLAGRTAVIHGLHKGWMIENQGVVGEKCKREFWNTYICDRWLSCLMGRPAMIPDESVDVALPVDVPGSTLPPAAGIRAHIELAMIMDEIVNKLYGTTSRERSINELIPGVEAVISKLELWLAKLPISLQLEDEIKGVIPQRSCLILHMMYNQLWILSTRPLLFIAVKHAVAAGYIPSKAGRPPPNISSAKRCAEGARRNTLLCRQLLESNQASAFSTLDYHYAFTAAIALQLARLVPEVSVPSDEESVNFLSHYLVESGAQGNESATDCAKMVRELGAFVSRLLVDPEKHPTIFCQTNDNNGPPVPHAQSPNGRRLDTSNTIQVTHGPQTFQGDSFDFNTLPEGQLLAYQELSSWFSDNPS